MITATEAFLIGAGALGILLGILEVIARASHYGKSLLGAVLLGADGRTSTSKTFVFLWTLLVAWALISLLIAGEFVNLHGCTSAATAAPCAASHDPLGVLQVGWQNFRLF